MHLADLSALNIEADKATSEQPFPEEGGNFASLFTRGVIYIRDACSGFTDCFTVLVVLI